MTVGIPKTRSGSTGGWYPRRPWSPPACQLGRLPWRPLFHFLSALTFYGPLSLTTVVGLAVPEEAPGTSGPPPQ